MVEINEKDLIDTVEGGDRLGGIKYPSDQNLVGGFIHEKQKVFNANW